MVRSLTVMASSRAEAEELVQDAFVKLLPRWGRVSRYDQPEAWVRHVAVRALISRRRRLLVALRAQVPSSAGTSDPGIEERLDVHAALRTLPLIQRVVLVLHHGLGLPVQAISEELNIPVGTVKSRLARGRTAFSAEYTGERSPDARPPRQEAL